MPSRASSSSWVRRSRTGGVPSARSWPSARSRPYRLLWTMGCPVSVCLHLTHDVELVGREGCVRVATQGRGYSLCVQDTLLVLVAHQCWGWEDASQGTEPGPDLRSLHRLRSPAPDPLWHLATQQPVPVTNQPTIRGPPVPSPMRPVPWPWERVPLFSVPLTSAAPSTLGMRETLFTSLP